MPVRQLAQRIAGLAAVVCFVARGAMAQVPDQPYVVADGRVTVAGELSAVVSPPDDASFFNYTDYDHNALRIARGRLLGEWRLPGRLTALGEFRVENGDSLEVAALYARWRPWERHAFDVQVGRVPPVIGAFARRAYGRDNLVIGTPLAYQYLTSLRPDAIPATTDDLLRMRGRGWQPFYPVGSPAPAPGISLASAFRWDTGIEAHWRHDWLDLAGAITEGSPAVPVVRETNDGRQWSTRVALTSMSGLTFGVSAARGDWIENQVLQHVPAEYRQHAAQSLAGMDVEFGRGPLLTRGEIIYTTFELPMIGATPVNQTLKAWSAFGEARYRWHPRWQVAARVDRLSFSDIAGALSAGLPTPWDAPVDRVEGVLVYRALRNLEVRGGWQENWRQSGRVRQKGFPAMQAIYWF
jgi:hypothetical protein